MMKLACTFLTGMLLLQAGNLFAGELAGSAENGQKLHEEHCTRCHGSR